MHKEGWLQDVFDAASKRVDEWPEWKKSNDAKKSEIREPANKESEKRELKDSK